MSFNCCEINTRVLLLLFDLFGNKNETVNQYMKKKLQFDKLHPVPNGGAVVFHNIHICSMYVYEIVKKCIQITIVL